MSEILDKHIELIEAVNNSKTVEQHDINMARLDGFRIVLDIVGVKSLIDCDNYYLKKGINRMMCCGVFLDWKPEAPR